MTVYIPSTSSNDINLGYLQENYASKSFVTNIVGTSASPAFVALTGDQTVAGNKTFLGNIDISGSSLSVDTIVGDVSGNLLGDVSGNVTGNLLGGSVTTDNLTINSSNVMVINSGSDQFTIMCDTAGGAVAGFISIPRQSGSSKFVLTEGAQTLNGIKTFGGTLNLTGTSNLGVARYTRLLRRATAMNTTTVRFLGDSIMAGNGVGSNRWPTQLCTLMGWTEDNLSVSGRWICDVAQAVYSNTKVDQATIICAGTNNIIHSNDTNAYDLAASCIQAIAVYSSIPSSRIQDVRTGSVTKTGTWVNTPAYSIGMGSVDWATPASISTTVYGRFVCFSHAITNVGGPTWTKTTTLSITIDGVAIQTNTPWVGRNASSTLTSATWESLLWIYDTAPADRQNAPAVYDVPHTIVISVGTLGANTQPAYVEWISGFDFNQPSSNTVLVGNVGFFDKSSSVVGAGSTATREYVNSLNTEMKNAVDQLTDYYGLPIYYVPIYDWTDAELQADKVHPNIIGNTRIARNVQNFLATAT